MDNNLWDSIADVEGAQQQQEQEHKAAGGGWGLGVAFTKLRGTAPPTMKKESHHSAPGSNHGEAPIAVAAPSTSKYTEEYKRRSSTPANMLQNAGVASALWRLGGRDDNNNSTTSNEDDQRPGEGGFWNNLKKGHDPEVDTSLSGAAPQNVDDESDYGTDTELDTWQQRGKRDKGLLSGDDDLEIEPQFLRAEIPKPEPVQVPQYKDSTFVDDIDEADNGSDADSEINHRDTEIDEESVKLGLGAFLSMGNEAALEEELKAYMNPDPENNSIADMSLVSASIPPAEQIRLLMQRMDMSLGKSISTMLNPEEVATKELRPWRQQKHLRRGSALGAMPPAALSMLNALAKDESDGDESQEDELYTIPAGFERALDRHIPRDNFDGLWKDGAATVCSASMQGDRSRDEEDDNFDHDLVAKKVQGKLDAEERTSLFPDADEDIRTVAQQKLRDEILALTQAKQTPDPKPLSSDSGRRSSRGTKKIPSPTSNVDRKAELTERRRKSDGHETSRHGSAAKDTERRQKLDESKNSRRESASIDAETKPRRRRPDERKSSRSASAPTDADDLNMQKEEMRRKAGRERGRSASKRDGTEDCEKPLNDTKASKESRPRSARSSPRKPELEGDSERRRRSNRSSRSDKEEILDKCRDKERSSRRPTRSGVDDASGGVDDSQGKEDKERSRHKSSRRSSDQHAEGGVRENTGDIDTKYKRGTSDPHEIERVRKVEKDRRRSSTMDAAATDDKNKSSRSSDGPLLDDAKGALYNELKPWRRPKQEVVSRNSLSDVTDKHENTALKALEARSRAAATNSNRKLDAQGQDASLQSIGSPVLDHTRSNRLPVSKVSDGSRKGTSSTGTGATAETISLIAYDDNDPSEARVKTKKKGFFASLISKKNNHAKLEDLEDANGLVMEQLPVRRASLESHAEARELIPAPRHRGSNDMPGRLGTTRRKPDSDAIASLTAGLMSLELVSSDGWGSLDDDEVEPKKQPRRRSASVPKYAGDTLSKGDRRPGSVEERKGSSTSRPNESSRLPGTTRRKPDGDATAPLAADLFTAEDVDEPKKERKKRSASVPKYASDVLPKSDRRHTKSSRRKEEVVALDASSERRKSRSSTNRSRGADYEDPSSRQRTSKSSSRPSSRGSDSPHVKDDSVDHPSERSRTHKKERDRVVVKKHDDALEHFLVQKREASPRKKKTSRS
jgi:hypothetical protein